MRPLEWKISRLKIRGTEWLEESSCWKEPKKIKAERLPQGGAKPTECPPMETGFRAKIGGGGEETKTPNPPRRLLLTMGGPKRVEISPSV